MFCVWYDISLNARKCGLFCLCRVFIVLVGSCWGAIILSDCRALKWLLCIFKLIIIMDLLFIWVKVVSLRKVSRNIL